MDLCDCSCQGSAGCPRPVADTQATYALRRAGKLGASTVPRRCQPCYEADHPREFGLSGRYA